MFLLSPRDALQANVDHFSVWVTLSTVVVATGVALEGVELIHDATVWIKRRHLRKKELADLKEVASIFPASEERIGAESNIDHPRWVKRITRVGLILVVIGVVGEWRCGAKLEDAHNDLQKFDESLIAETQKQAARLNKDAEDEHSARVEAEEAVAWRRLTPSNRRKLKSELSRFSINRTWFQYNSNDIEAFDFGSDLAASVPTSWNPSEPEPVMSMREGPVKLGTNGPLQRGIRVAASGDKTYGKAADILAKLISSFGFDCERSKTVLAYNPQYAPMIVVTIDPRPEGSQGDAKLRREARRKQATDTQVTKP